MKTIDTRIIPNFLSDSEIATIEQFVMQNPDETWDSWHEKDNQRIVDANYYDFDFYNAKNQAIIDILKPKFDQHFGSDLYIQQIHILNAVLPYTVHSDAILRDGIALPEGYGPAWTFIIPVETVNSHTIVFNEYSEEATSELDNQITKDIVFRTQTQKPYRPPRIDDETAQKYFSHIDRKSLDYLSIKEIFPWTKGSLFAADRRSFHTSDNFLANGLKYKRAILSWTAAPL